MRGGQLGGSSWGPGDRTIAIAVGVGSGVPRLPGFPIADRVGIAVIDIPNLASLHPVALSDLSHAPQRAPSFSPVPVGAAVATAHDRSCPELLSQLRSATAQAVATPSGQPNNPIPPTASHLAWSTDGRAVAIAFDRELTLVDTTRFQIRWRRTAPSVIQDVSVSPDGCVVATADAQSIKLWSFDQGELVREIADSRRALRPRFGTDDSLYWLDGWQIRSTSFAAGREHVVATPWYHLADLALTPDGQYAVVTDLSAVSVYRLDDGVLVRQWLSPGFNANGVAVDASGRRVAMGDFHGTVRVWSIEDGTKQAEFMTSDSVHELAFSADGNYMLVQYYGLASIEIFNIGSGKRLFVGDKENWAAALSPDGQTVAMVLGSPARSVVLSRTSSTDQRILGTVPLQ